MTLLIKGIQMLVEAKYASPELAQHASYLCLLFSPAWVCFGSWLTWLGSLLS